MWSTVEEPTSTAAFGNNCVHLFSIPCFSPSSASFHLGVYGFWTKCDRVTCRRMYIDVSAKVLHRDGTKLILHYTLF